MHLALICGTLDAQQPAGTQTIMLANDLVERGYRVTLLALSGSGDELDPRVDLLVAGPRPRWLWLGLLRYQRWVTTTLDNVKPDGTISLLSTMPANVMAPLTGTVRARSRVQRNLRSGILGQLVQRLCDLRPSIAAAHLLERRAMSRDTVQTFIAITEPIKAQLQLDRPGNDIPIECASIPIPEQQLDPTRASQLREQLARAWGLSSNRYWVVFPFVDAQLDGFEPMLRAVKPAIEQGIDATLLLAGPTRYTHMAWIGQLGLRDRVRFVGQTDMLQELMSASDLIVCPTSHDPAGWAVRSAVGLGKPIITTAACGIAQEVSSSGGGVLASPTQPQALLEAIRDQHARWESGGGSSHTDRPDSPQAPTLAQVIDRWAQLRDAPN